MRSLAILLLLLVPGLAVANGRAPSTSTINFRRGSEMQIAAGMTFGVVHSTDNGVTWRWVCEDAVGYGGNYDPDYAFTSTGALFATTFDGLKVNRDTCTYDPSTLSPTPPAIKFFSAITVDPSTGHVYAAAADPADAKIYKSTDDGVTFPANTAANPGQLMDWWQSIEVAPSDPTRVYLTGYRLAGQVKTFLLFRSDDSGATFQPMTLTGFDTLMSSSIIEIAGVAKVDAGGTLAKDIIYVTVRLSDNTISDALYRSINGGQTWTKLIEKANSLSFVARASGELVVGTQALGTHRATETGTATLPTFTEILPTIACTETADGTDSRGNPKSLYTCSSGLSCVESNRTVCGTTPGLSCLCEVPHVNCLAENTAGEVWACTQNYGSATAPKDSFGIMKTTDVVNWTGMLRFQDLMAPLTCADGTVQKDRCDTELWCGLCAQLGCDPARDCSVAPDGPPTDGAPVKKAPCCGGGSDDIPGLMAICMVVGLVVLRRRRRI